MDVEKIAQDILKQADEDLQPGWERATIILESDPFNKLKALTDVKGIFVKDVVNGLIKIYNKVALTDKDKRTIEETKEQLLAEVQKLVELQEDAKEQEQK